ncbi:UDP-N-acetylmuramoyl-tripeptide--D-alanyl-D-alanine ligase [Novosphingopyxis sp.]|uniref:UDP-N-acetylmuramoyl-tripeptide--D-alanyl-D- alanine ligase n=1 Tax=Novosphingopyxis sp. TaxID=2709690 RepID=UPI003B5B770F
MTALWTASEIADATGGEAHGDFAVDGVAFDSREVSTGDLFVALSGEMTDGHKFLDGAFANGAAGAVTERAVGHPHVRVADTAEALRALGRASLARANAKIIGVTGSAGKTGTKEMLFAALDRSSRGQSHRSLKSYNNHVGVPLSLARMPRGTAFGIFEMGMNHPGELSDLTQLVRPDVAIVTTIAPAHVEFFPDETAIARAKSEIFEGLSDGGTAIIPRDSPHFQLLRDAAMQHGATIVSFGFHEEADVRAAETLDRPGGSLVTARVGGAMLCYRISQPGRHIVANSLAVLAAVEAVGGDLASAGLALAELPGLAGRGARHQIAHPGGAILLIDESYNANPASMRAAIEGLANTPHERRVAVLGAMKELGEKSAGYHADIAPLLAAAQVDEAIFVGPEFENLVEKLGTGLEGPARFAHCETAAEATELLRAHIKGGEAVLVKGSNSVGLSRLVSSFVDGEN